MDLLLSRFRNLTALLVIILAQLVLLAYQVKSRKDVPLIRVWAVTAVTPVAQVLETVRSNTVRFFRNYFFLRDTQDENRRLREELGQLKLQNQFLRTELETADRVRALTAFRERTPSRTIAARVIMSGTGASANAVFIDRGSTSGVVAGMAVITPDGIVGMVLHAYPTASQVLLVTDPGFAAGVITQKGRIHGTLKGGAGRSTCMLDHVQNEEKVEVGEWLYTSGDDRIFPKGLPAGQVRAVREGKRLKEIVVSPSGLQAGLEEVLVVVEGVHQELPDASVAPSSEFRILQPPAPAVTETTGQPEAGAPAAPQQAPSGPRYNTEADRLREKYQRIGEAQKHVFGEGLPGSKPPDFNMKAPPAGATQGPAGAGPGAAGAGGATPGTPQQTAPSGRGSVTPPAQTDAAKPVSPRPPATAPADGAAQPPAASKPKPSGAALP
ncbi:MAG: rod shape-determining protein MreC [Bryobacteraceae bacterium]|nr:rod shape-determining protein MreC [Bryobacteraceae bacterium]